MAPVTEVAILPIKPDADAATVSSILDTNIATLLAQPGCLRVRSSRVHEEPHKLRLFADWESLELHRAFGAKPDQTGPFLQRMGTIIDAAAAGPGPRKPPYHVEFAPFPPVALNGTAVTGGATASKGPVTEILTMYFPSDVSEGMRDATAQTTREFVRKLGAFADGFTGETAVGWSVETDVDYKGEPHRALVTVIGWTSVDEHMKVREHPEFAKIIPMIRGLEGVKGMEMVHVTNTTIERS
ncbi:hypothetical protein F5Y13DRAFT_100192 [Hypoxylon sp. FL1857]|nr:hypothetical protein F5Y13DRAFT_100192 [Hypoxylon sp. FL1857]